MQSNHIIIIQSTTHKLYTPHPTLQKAEKAKRLAKEEAEKKLLEMAERTKSELQELLLASK